MYVANDLTFNTDENTIKRLYQPVFPLKYDKIYGPYTPITSEIGSMQQNFQNLLLTNPGEWPFNPDLGIGLRRYLFETFDSPELGKLKPRIHKQLEKFLPEVVLYDVRFSSTDEQKDESFLKIMFRYSIWASSFFELIAELNPARKIMTSIVEIERSYDVFLGSSKFLTSGVTEST